MIKIFKNKERKFLKYEQILYTQIPFEESEILEELLFKKSCEELNITQNFNYQMSYILDANLAHIFLTLSHNIDFKSDEIYAQPLLFSAYKNDENTCFIHFDKNQTYACFYAKNNLKNYKIIPNFSLNKLATQNLNESFEKVLKQGRLGYLLEKYEITRLILINDNFDFSTFCKLNLKLSCLREEQTLYAELLQNIQISKSANFIKVSPSSLNLWQKSIILFLCSFFLALIPSFFQLYENHKILQEKEIIKNSLAKLKTQEQNLNIVIAKKQKLNNENEQKLNKYREISKILDENFIFTNALKSLYYLSKLLQNYGVKIDNLMITTNQIFIQTKQNANIEKLLNELHLNTDFTLKKKELKNEIYYIELELR